jgi:hypothetical protein
MNIENRSGFVDRFVEGANMRIQHDNNKRLNKDLELATELPKPRFFSPEGIGFRLREIGIGIASTGVLITAVQFAIPRIIENTTPSQAEVQSTTITRIDRIVSNTNSIASVCFGEDRNGFEIQKKQLSDKYKIHTQHPDIKGYEESLRTIALDLLKERLVANQNSINELQRKFTLAEKLIDKTNYTYSIETLPPTQVLIDFQKYFSAVENIDLFFEKLQEPNTNIDLKSIDFSALSSTKEGFQFLLSYNDSKNDSETTQDNLEFIQSLRNLFTNFDMQVIQDINSKDLVIQFRSRTKQTKIGTLPPSSLLAQVRKTRSSL